MEDTTPSGSIGPLFATIIIVLLFLVGGVYFFIKQDQRNRELRIQNEQMQLPAHS